MQEVKTEVSPFFSPLKTRAQRTVALNQNVAGNKNQENIPSTSNVTKRKHIKIENTNQEDIQESNAIETKIKPKVIKTKQPTTKKQDNSKPSNDEIETKNIKASTTVQNKKRKGAPKMRTLEPSNVVVPDIENCWQPKNWEQMLKNIQEMRKDRSAPVDTMGCHKCSDDNADEKV